MEYYYREGDSEIGPLSEGDFQFHVEMGKIKKSTPVRTDEMPNWVPYSRFLAGDLRGDYYQEPSYGGPESAYAPSEYEAQLQPALYESLQESQVQWGGKEGPGLFRRLVAYVADCFVCAAVFLAGTTPFLGPLNKANERYQDAAETYAARLVDKQRVDQKQEAMTREDWRRYGLQAEAELLKAETLLRDAQVEKENSTRELVKIAGLVNAIYFGVYLLYFTLLHGAFGATAGKFLLGIRVQKSNGEPIGFVRAFLRHIALVFCMLLLSIVTVVLLLPFATCIGILGRDLNNRGWGLLVMVVSLAPILWYLRDVERHDGLQALHDRMASTEVVRR